MIQLNEANDLAVRTVFASDLHLGSKHAQAEHFLAFLKSHRPEQLYLVGDFIDGIRLRRKWYWTQQHSSVLELVSAMAKKGMQVFCTPGNHDDFLRDNVLLRQLTEQWDSAVIADDFVFESVSGRRFLVIHGDRFDKVENGPRWLSIGATFIYEMMLSADRFVSRRLRRKDRSPYVVTAAVKRFVKRVIRFVSNFEAALKRHAEESFCDGVICGHIHTPRLAEMNGFLYFNTGDWVEHCTALVEYEDGSLVLKSFYGDRELAKAQFDATPDAAGLLLEGESPFVFSSEIEDDLEEELEASLG